MECRSACGAAATSWSSSARRRWRTRGSGAGLVAGRERHSDGEPPAVRLAVLGLVVVSLVLAGCGVFRHRPMTAEASRSPAGEAGRSAAPAAPAAPEPPKLAEQLTRV